jgi:hypothetical protein
MLDPLRRHQDALVIDGLVYHCDGDVADLKAGGVNALNVTTCHSELPKLTAALARRGWREEHIRAYLGENLRRVLDGIWRAGGG